MSRVDQQARVASERREKGQGQDAVLLRIRAPLSHDVREPPHHHHHHAAAGANVRAFPANPRLVVPLPRGRFWLVLCQTGAVSSTYESPKEVPALQGHL